MAKAPRSPKDPAVAKAEAVVQRLLSGVPMKLDRWAEIKAEMVRDGLMTQYQQDQITREVAEEMRRLKN